MSAASDRLAAITATSFANGAHRTAFPAVCNDTATVANEIAADKADAEASKDAADNAAASASASATSASGSATAAQTSRVAAENAVASVTVGSTNSLAYPEQVRNLITAADVVDVFVYDTRLDSDGGAWTERCAGTSWFNEALNTATRGAKRAFPKVALIVARALSITIYDALDLDPATGAPRLWMSFTGASSKMVVQQVSALIPVNGIFALNGRLWRSSASFGLIEIDFPADLARRFGTDGMVVRPNIAQRDVDLSPWGFTGNTTAYGANVNSPLSVHAAVLPGAPTDLAGLPIPSPLVAHSAGFTVLHTPDFRPATVTLSGGFTRARFISNGARIATWGVSVSPASGALIGPTPYAASTNWGSFRSIGTGGVGASLPIPRPVSNGVFVDAVDGVLAQLNGLNLVAEDLGSSTNSLVAGLYYHSASGVATNTGWMPAAGIQLAALCDSVTGSIAAAQPVNLDGTSVAGFTTVAATVASVGGEIEITASGVGARALFSFPTIAGQTYIVRGTGRRGTTLSIIALAVMESTDSTFLGASPNVSATNNTQVSFQFTATGATSLLRFRDNGDAAGGTSYWDNITVTLVVPDRSYREAPLDIVGSLSRAAVATDAEMVAYSGFNNLNYLSQPYNAALDVGTGDICFAAWVLDPDGASWVPFDRGTPSGLVDARIQVNIFSGIPNIRTFIGNNQVVRIDAPASIAGTGWRFLVAIRRSGVLELWVDGVRVATAAETTNLTNANATLTIGVEPARMIALNPNARISMIRVSTYAPTQTQIERMFRDERPLFRSGAKAFLGNGAGAFIRRLSRSRYTNRLAVAMTDGLAIMDGLQRVERQTVATLSPAMASDNVTLVSMEAGLTLIGTTANAGVRRAAINGLDLMPINAPSPQMPRTFRALGVTTDATPLTLSPRIQIGERELVVVRALITARVYGAADTESLTYERRATYYRDAGGNVTIRGSVQTIGTDVEVTSTADATLVIDTTAQTIAAQVTGIAATRLVWTVRFQVERNSREASYEEVV